MPDKRSVGTQLPPTDMLARTRAEDALARAGNMVQLATNFVADTTALSIIEDADNDWIITVEVDKTYRVQVLGKFSTTDAACGVKVGVVAVGATGQVVGSGRVAVDKELAPVIVNRFSRDTVEIAEPLINLPWTMTTEGITSVGHVQLDFIFTCATAGTLQILWGAEVAAQEATLFEGSSLIVQTWG